MKLKIMTYNIQHGRNHNLPGDVIDFANTAIPVLRERPDALGLNEVRRGGAPGFADQPAELAALCGGTPLFGRAISLGENKDYGNAILSKFPVLAWDTVAIPDPTARGYDGYYESRVILRAKLDVNGRPLTVLSTHVGLNPDEQDSAVETIRKVLDETDTPVILMGDFNMTPDREQIGRLSEVLRNTAAELGNVEFTFSSDRPHVCIDYIWYRGLTPLEIHAVQGVYSDHFPLAAVFEF